MKSEYESNIIIIKSIAKGSERKTLSLNCFLIISGI